MRIILYIGIVTFCCQSFFNQKMLKEKVMRIKSDKSVYYLGEAIPVDVVVSNPKDATVILENPSTSPDVIMHFVAANDQHDYYYSMQKTTVLTIDASKDQYATIDPPKQEISLLPSGTFQFTTDVNDRLFVAAGKYDCFVTSNADTSNHIPIQVAFNASSVDHLFTIVKDNSIEYSRRKWAMEALQIIQPSFKPGLFLDNVSESEKKSQELHNIPVYKAFTDWWQKNKTSIQVTRKFDQ